MRKKSNVGKAILYLFHLEIFLFYNILHFEKLLSSFSLLCIFKCLKYIFHEKTTSWKNINALAKIILDLFQIEWLSIHHKPVVIFMIFFTMPYLWKKKCNLKLCLNINKHYYKDSPGFGPHLFSFKVSLTKFNIAVS